MEISTSLPRHQSGPVSVSLDYNAMISSTHLLLQVDIGDFSHTARCRALPIETSSIYRHIFVRQMCFALAHLFATGEVNVERLMPAISIMVEGRDIGSIFDRLQMASYQCLPQETTEPLPLTPKITQRHIETILAALNLWKRSMHNKSIRSEEMALLRIRDVDDIDEDIATDSLEIQKIISDVEKIFNRIK